MQLHRRTRAVLLEEPNSAALRGLGGAASMAFSVMLRKGPVRLTRLNRSGDLWRLIQLGQAFVLSVNDPNASGGFTLPIDPLPRTR